MFQSQSRSNTTKRHLQMRTATVCGLMPSEMLIFAKHWLSMVSNGQLRWNWINNYLLNINNRWSNDPIMPKKLELQLLSKRSSKIYTVGASPMCGASRFHVPAEQTAKVALRLGRWKLGWRALILCPLEVTCSWRFEELHHRKVQVAMKQLIHLELSSKKRCRCFEGRSNSGRHAGYGRLLNLLTRLVPSRCIRSIGLEFFWR